ncbi:MAG: hypothetical protein WBP59_17830 [Ilumatobacteraceae bacterium]
MGVLTVGLVGASLIAAGTVDATVPIDDGTGHIEADMAELADHVAETEDALGVSGLEAVELLDETATTEIVAGNAGMDPGELVSELLEDSSLFVTGDGMVGYADIALGSVVHDEAVEDTSALGPATCTDASALSSLPGSGKVLLLDFDGHTTSGDPAWNNGNPIVSVAYPGAAAEKCEIWRRVAEDFLPFDVNVTTIDPGLEGLRRTSTGDQDFGQRMVISPTNWRDQASLLGLALVGSFESIADRSAFVFTSQLGPANIAEAVSHEAGHTLWLSHDGQPQVEYYPGHGLWAPLMGSPISRQVTQWSKGEYTNPSNTEDDLAEIAGVTGYRTDDHGGTRASGTVVGSSSTTTGFIGTIGDVDVFVVNAAAGQLDVTVRPALASGSNLLASVTVRSAGGAIVAQSAVPASVPANWSAVASGTLPAGQYSIEVRGVGFGSPLDTGFSSYGSLGEYTVGVSDGGPPTTAALTSVLPDRLLDTRIGLGGSRRVAAGGTIRLQVTGRSGVPFGATAAVVNVVAANPSNEGYITAYPCSVTRPTTATLNFQRGQTVANTAMATLSPDGDICLYALSATDIVVDVTAWLGPAGTTRLTSIGPDRVMDTRIGLGGSTRLGAGATAQLSFAGLPAGTTAVALNVAVVNPALEGYVTVYPCASTRPFTATINHAAGDIRPNNTIVGLSSGRVCIFSLAAADIVVDLTGYFGASGLSYVPSSPDRVLDTRTTTGALGAGGAISYRAASASIGAQAASVNIAAVAHPLDGYVTSYDCITRKKTATLNPHVGEVNSNGAIAKLGNGLDSCLYTLGGGQLVVDLNGWWVP